MTKSPDGIVFRGGSASGEKLPLDSIAAAASDGSSETFGIGA